VHLEEADIAHRAEPERPVSIAVVVPGHSRRGRVSRRCLRLVAAAAAIADELGAGVVVFSGLGEAEAMRTAWPGRTDLELVVEPTARITAENAARTLPLLRERGVTRAVVVCGRTHAARVRFFFRTLYSRYGVETEVRPVGLAVHPGSLVREMGAALVAGRQRRAAHAEVEGTLNG
jgi:uncharacterized SAM-binding protein YcdF (DUF218 family)